MPTDNFEVDVLVYVALVEEFQILADAIRKDLGVEIVAKEIPSIAAQLFTVELPPTEKSAGLTLGFIPAGKMGVTRAASLTSHVLTETNCNDLVVIGIAGSLSNDLQPGDVLIPDSVVEFLANAAAVEEPDSSTWDLQTSGNSYPTNPRLLNKFQFFQTSNATEFGCWEADCQRRRRTNEIEYSCERLKAAGHPMRDNSKLFAGDDKKLASGSIVGKSLQFADWLKGKIDRKFVALEMESAGIHDAATIRTPPPRILTIRGISDFADERKKIIEELATGHFREFATVNALSLLLRAIEAGFFDSEEIKKKRSETSKKWETVNRLSNEWLDQIRTSLPNGLRLARKQETEAIDAVYSTSKGGHILGESGAGKSAHLKRLAATTLEHGGVIIWINATNFEVFQKVGLAREAIIEASIMKPAVILVDSLENCYDAAKLNALSQFLAGILNDPRSGWQVFVSCQTSAWVRVCSHLTRDLGEHQLLTKRIDCGLLSEADFSTVLEQEPTLLNLSLQPGMRRILRSPKMLDIILRNEAGIDRLRVGEADVVQWWWDEQVKGGIEVAGEEAVARKLAIYLADNLTNEAPPDIVSNDNASTLALVKRQILQRTLDGRFRFDHDLLGDWSRVMHLRSLGADWLEFARGHTENPPWLRAIRILSQHLIDRASDTAGWRSVVESCRELDGKNELSAQNLQILDAWLEGIVHCDEPEAFLEKNKDIFFSFDGWLLDRLCQRLLFCATIPDPVLQKQFQAAGQEQNEIVSTEYRIPLIPYWLPFLEFLSSNTDAVTDLVPVSLGKIGLIWGRLAEYIDLEWDELAKLLIICGEKELKREVAGVDRYDGSGRPRRSKNSRTIIYSSALLAGSLYPDRVGVLARKAAGRQPWEEDDIAGEVEDEWLGKYHEHSIFGSTTVIDPVEAWEQGPIREISDSFRKAWFSGRNSLPLFRAAPGVASEVLMALLIEWPKKDVRGDSYGLGGETYGFRFETDRSGSAFWSAGPFYSYLQSNWKVAVQLIVDLINFATDRYEEWWTSPQSIKSYRVPMSQGAVEVRGNEQVFSWYRYHMNTPRVITSALMALDKWLSDYEEITGLQEAVVEILKKGRSLALIGVLIDIGKRRPELFLSVLKPLLFVREFYHLDLSAINMGVSTGSFLDGDFMYRQHRDWESRPGYKDWLRDEAQKWMFARPEFRALYEEVSDVWIGEAEALDPSNPKRREIERWAVLFDPRLWQRKDLGGGVVEYVNERLAEYQEPNVQEEFQTKQALLMLPSFCQQRVEKYELQDSANCEGYWKALNDRDFFQRADKMKAAEPGNAQFLEGKNAKAGLIAVLVCLGDDWLQEDPSRIAELDAQTWEILNDPPKITTFSAEEIHQDYECLLARVAIRRWASNPGDSQWMREIARFLGAFRYETIRNLFDEAVRCRAKLGAGYRHLEALALHFAFHRERAAQKNSQGPFTHMDITEDLQEPIAEFLSGKGPDWVSDWNSITFDSTRDTSESTEESPQPFGVRFRLGLRKLWNALFRSKPDESRPPSADQEEDELIQGFSTRTARRTYYPLNMGVILASFAHLPALSDAEDESESDHWIEICRQMLGLYLSTLPLAQEGGAEWGYDVSECDQKIAEIVSSRIFELPIKEGEEFWKRFLKLPPAAHHHVDQFLNAFVIEAFRDLSGPRFELFGQLWHAFAEYLSANKDWVDGKNVGVAETWQILLFIRSHFTNQDLQWRNVIVPLRPHYIRYCESVSLDTWKQSAMADFLATKAGSHIIVDGLVWLRYPGVERQGYYWESCVSEGGFERLLAVAWKRHFTNIQKNAEALDAFKYLVQHLASYGSTVALEIQSKIGS